MKNKFGLVGIFGLVGFVAEISILNLYIREF